LGGERGPHLPLSAAPGGWCGGTGFHFPRGSHHLSVLFGLK
jgi:hypothetical protein